MTAPKHAAEPDMAAEATPPAPARAAPAWCGSGPARTFRIPGVLERRDPVGAPLPVVFDSPHSGEEYPEAFQHALTREHLRSTEDRFVDELFAPAPAHGATLLRALFPRAWIDVNRQPLDIDAALLAEPWPEPLQPSGKTKNGKGLIRSQALGEPLYARKLSVAEVRARLEGYYHPYHEALAAIVAERRRAFGAIWHVNCHSWSPPESGPDGKPVRHVDFFLGDREGTTADPAFTESVAAFLRGHGYEVRVNRLFKGMELVRRHGRPAQGQHSLQIEINRALYLNGGYGKGEGFGRMQALVEGLIRHVCAFARAAQ